MSDQPKLHRLGSLKVYVVLDDSSGLASGGILIARRNAQTPNLYADLFEAHRSRLEILFRYGIRQNGELRGGELDSLATAREHVRAARETLGNPGVRDSAAERQATGSFGDISFWLKRGLNPAKVSARDKAKAGVVRTEKGTLNRGATRARLTAVDDRLALREDEVRNIVPWMAAMETALRLELQRSLKIVDDTERRVAAILNAHPMFRERRFPVSQRQAVAVVLGELVDSVGTLVAAPFRAFGSDSVCQLQGAAKAALLGDPLGAQVRLQSVRDGSRRLQVRKQIEAFLLDVTVASICGATPSVRQALADRVKKLADRLRAPDRLGACDGSVPTRLLAAVPDLTEARFDEAKERLKLLAHDV